MSESKTVLKTPLNRWHHENGAKMVDFAGWDMPVQYSTGILKEHLATRRFGGLFDVSHMGRFRVSGADRMAFLLYALTGNAEALEPWQAQYTMIPNSDGGLIDDAYLYRFGKDDYMLVVNASNRDADLEHLENLTKCFSDVQIEDHTDELAMIAIQGPETGKILGDLLEDGSLPEPQHNSLSEGHINGEHVLLARTGYTGEPIGFEIFLPAQQATDVWCKLLETGHDRGIVPVGLGARDTLRLEAGMPLYGHEFGVDPEGNEFPAFAFPLTRVAVSFSPHKGDFYGSSPLRDQFRDTERIRYDREPEKLKRMIRPIAVLDRGAARQADRVILDGKDVGFVTSGTTVPCWVFEKTGVVPVITDQTENRAVALACIDWDIPPGCELEIQTRRRALKAAVVKWHGRSDAPPYFRPIPASQAIKEASVPRKEPRSDKAEILLKKAVENHNWRQKQCMNLIPSEMTPSTLVRLLQIADPVGRYAEHKKLAATLDEEVFYYQGTDFIEWVEQRVCEEMAEYLGCPLVEPRTISGQMANMTVFSAMVDYINRGNRKVESRRINSVVNNHIGKGGHLSSQPMGALRDYVARNPITEKYAVTNLPVCKDNPYRIDIQKAEEILQRAQPELIILGKSMVLHPEPVSEIRRIVESINPRPIIMYDMAHVLGLIGPHFQQPFSEGADIVTGSTHKTFFGPQRGVVGASFEEESSEFALWEAIQRRAFPGMVSNHHLGTLLALLMAAIEMNTFGHKYQKQVITNAKSFAVALKNAGVNVEGDPAVDFTETHQVIVRVDYAKGCEVAENLEKNNIIVNYQALPSDESFTASSGLRIGVSEMTRFGMKEPDFQRFAELFANAIDGSTDVSSEVSKFRSDFDTMQYCFKDDSISGLAADLVPSPGA